MMTEEIPLIAKAICNRVYSGNGCACDENSVSTPCANMMLAACEALRIIDEKRSVASMSVETSKQEIPAL
jgi:hypothetical protein